MIRVNLLAGRAAVRRELLPAAQRPALAGVLFLVVTTGALAGWWWHLGRQIAETESAVAQGETELTQLRAAARLVDRAVARKAELAEKLALIDRLRREQRGPVQLLSTINESLTDGLWLLELNQRGPAVQIEGRATSLTAVTDFVEHLQDSGAFDRPVEIVTTSMESLDEVSVVRFAVKAQAAGTAAAAAAAATATSSGAGRKGA